MSDYELDWRDKELHIVPAPPDALTSKVWVTTEGLRQIQSALVAYIEPCGVFPDGWYFPAEYLAELLNLEIITPHHYEREPDQMAEILAEGIAFDVVGADESDMEEQNADRIMALTNNYEG